MTELIQACEADLRGGRISQAAARLRTLKTAEIPREKRLALANLCRRAQMDYLALKILTPIVRPEKLGMAATQDEMAEYAASLLKIGAVHEAISILEKTQSVVAAQLYKAFCHFKRWEYAQAIPLLESYIQYAPSDYQKLVGKVNLASALAATLQFERSSQLLNEIIPYAKSQEHLRLWANACEVRAQIYIAESKYDEALKELTNAGVELDGPSDGLLIKKWTAIAQALKSKSLDPLTQFREVAENTRDWETLRDIDFFQLKIEHHEPTFQRLLFGTPFATYRERVTRDLNLIPTQTEFVLGSEGAAKFELLTGEVTGATTTPPGNTIHQLLGVLLSDLYRPWSIGSIFAELFQNEYFDVFSSPNRVHQLLWRLRKWFETNQLPVELTEYDGQYRIELRGEFAFVLPQQKAPLLEQEIYLRRIQSLFGRDSTFSSREVQVKLGISSSSFKRLASWALENKKLERYGSSRATVYRVVA